MDRLILVNGDNPVPPDYRTSIELASIEVEEGFSVSLEKETAGHYLRLRERLSSLGVRIEALSGYRSQETQARIWNDKASEHGEEYALRYVAKAGYSEHQTGLALDFTLYNDRGDAVEDDDAEAYGKVFPYLHEFGFILRYPAGKESVTGYPFEPWHIRYVGLEAARRIHGNGWTLEEYAQHVGEGEGSRP